MTRWIAAFILASGAFAQAPQNVTAPAQPSADVFALQDYARIEGQVLSDAKGQPLRGARLTLRPLEAGLSGVSVEADDEGRFAIRDISPGRYSLRVERDGYLSSSIAFHQGLRMAPTFDLDAGERLTDLTFRLRRWAVMSGQVKLDDGEDAVGATVELYRSYRARGRHGLRLAARGSTNDRGEYRIYGLTPGSYYVVAVYGKEAAVEEQPRVDAQGRELPVTGYAPTFFPGTTKLSGAVPVLVDYGDEVGGIDLNLELVRKVNIRGHVTSGLSGVRLSNARITLERVEASGRGTVPVAARARFDKEGNFLIPGVAPGSYVIRVKGAEGGTNLFSHKPLTVSEHNIDNLELMASPPRSWAGEIRTQGGAWPTGAAPPRLTLQPRSEDGDTLRPAVRGMRFECELMGEETYDVFVDNLPENFYLSAVRVGGSDMRAQGLTGSMASAVPFQIVIDSRGGRLSGRVLGPEGEVWSGANLVLVPEPPQSRLQDYRATAADEYGLFEIRGVAPGKYTLVGWLDTPPCNVYDPANLGACRATGMPLEVVASSDQNFEFNVKAPAR